MEQTLPDNIASILNDKTRLSVLELYNPCNRSKDKHLETITTLAASAVGMPVCYISILDNKNQSFCACHGAAFHKKTVEQSLCAHAMGEEDGILLIEDALENKEFSSKPIVSNDPNIRFYLAVPIAIHGKKLGFLCVADFKAHHGFDRSKIDILTKFAELATSHISLKLDSVDKSRFKIQHEREMQRHQLSLKAANVVSWIWNVDDNSLECDQELRDMFNITHNKTIYAEEIFSLIHPDDVNKVKKAIVSALALSSDYESQYRIKSTGRWVTSQGAVLERNKNGVPLKVAGVNLDITDQKRSEEKTKLLLKELNHRVKNTLAMLESIAAQTLKSSSSPEDFRRAFSGRIQGIAAAHTLLSDEEWGSIDIHQIISDQVHVYVADSSSQLEIVGDTVDLGPESALALGMVLHELTTNAVKYGALSVNTGKVRIKTQIKASEGKKFLLVEWLEENGPPVTKPESAGFGTIMITRSLDKVIGSSVDLTFLSAGVKANISIPV